ncbi:protein-(glutamine-N5) methyltransferase, release factor-specific [candidate division KSB1 bacterium 4572_119]|nr:MAG: protein-(glutamine-N5) methyltransferase, release factor-specific [candidate division KSB1 bacterium 4572_119]
MAKQSNYKVMEILNKMTDYLTQREIENSRLNAELLLGHVINLDRVQLYLNFEKPLTDNEIGKCRELLKRRGAREPLQHILGETEFYSLKFKVTPDTLIPRPETEILIDEVVDFCRKNYQSKQEIHVLDIGAGSGNISISLANTIKNALLTSIDISPAALKVGLENAEFHNVSNRITFLEVDIFQNVENSFPQFDIIVSNPPYISDSEFSELSPEVREHEPGTALSGGKDGLDYYLRIAELSERLFNKGGLIALEIGANQADQVLNIFKKTGLFYDLKIIKDLNQLNRVLIGNRKS